VILLHSGEAKWIKVTNQKLSEAISEGKAFGRSLYRVDVHHGCLVGIEKTFESNCQRANENFTD
jgi:hypothetical protein